MSLTKRKDWDEQWSRFVPKKIESLPLALEELLMQYLKRNPNFDCLEIGCVPGDFLIILHKIFGYRIHGIDYSNAIDLLYENFRFNNITAYKIYEIDFMDWCPTEKYDIVCSFGFIEHFRNPEKVIQKHIDLLKPEGTLIIGLPNFRYGQYILHKIVGDDANLAAHNLKIMDLKAIRAVLEENSLQILFLNYHWRFAFWARNRNGNFIQRMLLKTITATFLLVGNVTTKFGIRIKNKWLSPYIIAIARKVAKRPERM